VHARRGVDQPPLGARDAPSGRHGSDGALAARPRGPRQRSRERRRHGSTGPGRRRKALSAARRGLDGASFAATHLRSRTIDAGKPSAQRMSAQAETGRVRRGAGLGAPASPSRACGHPVLFRRTLRRVARTLAAQRAGEARSTIWERTRRRGGRSPHPRDAVGGSSTFELHRSVGRRAAAASEGVSPNLVAAVPMRPNPRVGAGVVVEIWSDR
jgi:hypothetical protein